jgi:hypothetical protein
MPRTVTPVTVREPYMRTTLTGERPRGGCRRISTAYRRNSVSSFRKSTP